MQLWKDVSGIGMADCLRKNAELYVGSSLDHRTCYHVAITE